MPPSCPSAGKNCDLDGAQTEGWVFHYLDTQPFREAMSRNGWEGLGWPAQRVEPLFIPPSLTAPRQSPLTEGLSYQARAQPLPRPNHQRKSSPKQTHQPPSPFRENQLWKPAPLAHAFRRTKDRAPPLRMSPNFIHRIYQAPQLCSNHARPNKSSEGLPRNKLSNPLQKQIGGKENKEWVGKSQAWLVSTHMKKQALPQDKQINHSLNLTTRKDKGRDETSV